MTLTPIEVTLTNNNEAIIPSSMSPVFVHRTERGHVAYVTNWTAKAEYDDNQYTLFMITGFQEIDFTARGEYQKQTWHNQFRKTTKQARKKLNGEFQIVDFATH